MKQKLQKKRIFDALAERRIYALVRGALAIVPFDKDIHIGFKYEHVGEGTFSDINIGAVNRAPYVIVVNIDWYETAEERDVKFILRHEARHLFQRNQIEKLASGKKTEVDPSIIRQWALNFDHYISNTPFTERLHFQQPCEIDAYVYATFIEATETMTSDEIDFSYTDYPVIGDLVANRVAEILKQTPVEDRRKYHDFFSIQRA